MLFRKWKRPKMSWFGLQVNSFVSTAVCIIQQSVMKEKMSLVVYGYASGFEQISVRPHRGLLYWEFSHKTHIVVFLDVTREGKGNEAQREATKRKQRSSDQGIKQRGENIDSELWMLNLLIILMSHQTCFSGAKGNNRTKEDDKAWTQICWSCNLRF